MVAADGPAAVRAEHAWKAHYEACRARTAALCTNRVVAGNSIPAVCLKGTTWLRALSSREALRSPSSSLAEAQPSPRDVVVVATSRAAGKKAGTRELVLPPLPWTVVYTFRDDVVHVLAPPSHCGRATVHSLVARDASQKLQALDRCRPDQGCVSSNQGRAQLLGRAQQPRLSW